MASVVVTSDKLTVIVPAFNEVETVGATVRSLRGQTLVPSRIVVVDDCSTDATATVAAAAGATVVRPPANTGSKAGAQTFALAGVETEFVLAVDADTTLAPDAIELLAPALADPRVAAASGSVIPRRIRSVWERGRYVEYLLAFGFFKRVQDQLGKPLIASGCFSMYRTTQLREAGGWSTRTMAEDMDLTWTLYANGHAVRFVPEAVSYPIEPHSFDFLRAQLRRWSHGFVQNVRLHRRSLLELGHLRSLVAVGVWDAVLASIAYLILFPVLAVLFGPSVLLAYAIDVPVLAVPILWQAFGRGEVVKALVSLPAFLVLRFVNGFFMLAALWRELVLNRPLVVYEKGH